MKKIIRVSLFFAALVAASTVSADNVVRVAASSELRLAIVDPGKASPARDAIHQAFAASLAEAVSAACGGPVEVKAKSVGADHAAFGLNAGVYDVVLSIGNTLPRALVLSDMVRLSATLGADRNEKKAFLVFTSADESLQKLLTASFASALGSPRFLDAFDGGFEKATNPANSRKLASAGD